MKLVHNHNTVFSARIKEFDVARVPHPRFLRVGLRRTEQD
jgi:hypothetical protein